MTESLSAHSSAHISLPQFGPVRSNTSSGHSHAVTFQIDLQYKEEESKATLLKRCSIPVPCNQTSNKQTKKYSWPMGKSVLWSIWEFKQKLLLCLLHGRKKDNAASKTRSKRVDHDSIQKKKESIRSLCKVVTKHQLPKPSPRGGKWTRWLPVNHPQR